MTKDELKELKIFRRDHGQCVHCGKTLPEGFKADTCYWCHKLGKLANNEGGWRYKIFREVLDHMGYLCMCCGETRWPFLTVDHRLGGGNEHRKEARKTSNEWLKEVVKDNYDPEKYQILCLNCNLGRERNGGVCPHNEEVV
jgi:hypothetical protein